jgi:hypothetical protein
MAAVIEKELQATLEAGIVAIRDGSDGKRLEPQG